jgi:hypothetical protein
MGWPMTNRVLLNVMDTHKKIPGKSWARLEKDPIGVRAMRMNHLRDHFDYEQLHFVQVDPKSIPPESNLPARCLDRPRLELVAVAFNDRPVLEATYGTIPTPQKLLEMETYFGKPSIWGRDEVSASITGRYGFELD